MKMTLGKKIFFMFFVPFLVVIGVLSVLVYTTMSQHINQWVRTEIKGITEINATHWAGQIESVRVAILSTGELLEGIDGTSENARNRVDNVLRSLFANEAVYNVWVVYEPDAFDGRDAYHTEDYPGAPSGRFMRSYVQCEESGEIVIAPDMEEKWIDNPDYALWYTHPLNSGRLYIDLDNDQINVWDYGVGGAPVYTLSIVSPIFRDGEVIGCVGADVAFDTMTISIEGNHQSTVAAFYSGGRIFFSPDMAFAEESIDTLGFTNLEQIRYAFENQQSLFLSDEYCIFNDERAFTFFQPVPIRHYDDASLMLYVSTSRSVMNTYLIPLMSTVAGAAVIILGILIFLLMYIIRRVSNPINQLTMAAREIAQGNIETEIGYFYDAEDEIGQMSQSLHTMVEQFRVHTLEMAQSQREADIKTRIEAFVTASDNARIFITGLAAMLCEYFNVKKITVVYLNGGKTLAFSTYNSKNAPKGETFEFLHHQQVESFMLGRRIAFMNQHTIRTLNANFLDKETTSSCLLPIRIASSDNTAGLLLGYIIIENSGMFQPLSEGDEAIMMYISKILGEWLQYTVWVPEEPEALEEPEETPVYEAEPALSEPSAPLDEKPDFITLCRQIEGMDVNFALEGLGGLRDVYEQSVKLTARTMTESINKMDEYIQAGRLDLFAIEVHGLKGALRNIGAITLSGTAAVLETAALEQNAADVDVYYPPFKEQLLNFTNQLNNALLANAGDTVKETINREALLTALAGAKTAALDFDAMIALEAMQPLNGMTYTPEADTVLEKILFALEAFDCEGAYQHILNLEEMLNE
jgi:HAMP domain-containing protein/HPt (histidine-containing phosphotransfer) domain-containing protein